jgi:hypothetical protein
MFAVRRCEYELPRQTLVSREMITGSTELAAIRLIGNNGVDRPRSAGGAREMPATKPTFAIGAGLPGSGPVYEVTGPKAETIHARETLLIQSVAALNYNNYILFN